MYASPIKWQSDRQTDTNRDQKQRYKSVNIRLLFAVCYLKLCINDNVFVGYVNNQQFAYKFNAKSDHTCFVAPT